MSQRGKRRGNYLLITLIFVSWLLLRQASRQVSKFVKIDCCHFTQKLVLFIPDPFYAFDWLRKYVFYDTKGITSSCVVKIWLFRSRDCLRQEGKKLCVCYMLYYRRVAISVHSLVICYQHHTTCAVPQLPQI